MQPRNVTPLRVSFALAVTLLAFSSTADAVVAAPIEAHRWTFDESSGSIAYDDANLSDGTLASSTTRTVGPFSTNAVTISPTGTHDAEGYVDFGKAVGAFGTADFTIAHWYKTTFNSPAKHGDIIGNRTAGSKGDFFSVRLVGDGSVVVEISDESGTNSTGISAGRPSFTVNDGEWHHLAYVRSGATITLYIDGVNAYSRANGTGQPTSIIGKSSFRIGRRLGTQYADAYTIPASFDDLRIFDSALDDNDIVDIYNGAL